MHFDANPHGKQEVIADHSCFFIHKNTAHRFAIRTLFCYNKATLKRGDYEIFLRHIK